MPVIITDLEKVSHTVEVTATTLYPAIALVLSASNISRVCLYLPLAFHLSVEPINPACGSSPAFGFRKEAGD